MSAMSRDKGHRGELEACAIIKELTGCDVRRRVRQHDGDSDLTGLGGWSIEVKRYRIARPGQIYGGWWPQAVEQARATGTRPLLLYRADRGLWTAVWPADLHTGVRPVRVGYGHTLRSEPSTWWAMCKGLTL